MKFKENKIRYGQDFSWWKGIPIDINFKVEKLAGDPGRFKLTGLGYGNKKDYGNGALYVYGLSNKQIAKFKKHIKKET